ncbi:zinc finger domain-containing protein [Shigella flexneri]
MEECDVCHGSGAEPGSQPQTCPTCHGAGQVQMRQCSSRYSRPVHTVRAAARLLNPQQMSRSRSVEKTKTLSVRSGVDTGDCIVVG